ncbi:fumarylacetoacetate hydrolase family protein [Bosea sp. TND4EK4]|uniref:fumarylacetoacetate hydrolase family protein n=1 Tax=Bosea sp. TND4EK4 TaxID=1907408 RepID=UPI0009544FAB|nr:fumarylacetoacetate hydrolase family protein [Bosea sp. TND4EK4]SIR27589.1 fumarylacetoacetate (FAA) hydrolase [Bosea sp. TND4EK4]
MKWASFRDSEHRERAALLEPDGLHALPPGLSLVQLLGDDGERLSRAAEQARASPELIVPWEDADLLAPIPQPPSLRDFYAFEQHARAGRRSRGLPMAPEWFEIPVFYFTNPAAVVASRSTVKGAPGSLMLDFEAEIAAVVGLPARDVAPEQAGRHIVGLMIMNDWSARDHQRKEAAVGLGPAKGKDFATTLGPYLVTLDELESARKGAAFDLSISASVNGRRYTTGNLADISWSFEEMLSFAARGATVRTGDIIGSGTCSTGCILELSQSHGADRFPWLSSGDQVVIEVERLGLIENTIVQTAEPHRLQPRLPRMPED